MDNQTQKSECCQKFDPVPWDGKTFEWKDKLFIREDLPQVFHFPLPWMIGKMITRMWKKAQDAHADPDMKDFLWLSYDPSPWKAENYIHVTKEVPDAWNVKLSGTFMAKVFDGPYNAAPKWIKEMEQYLSAKGKKAQKYYFYFTTCPKCAQKYGHNYTVVFAQV